MGKPGDANVRTPVALPIDSRPVSVARSLRKGAVPFPGFAMRSRNDGVLLLCLGAMLDCVQQ